MTEEHVVAIKSEFLMENKSRSQTNSSSQIVLPSTDSESVSVQHNSENSTTEETAANKLSENIEVLATNEIKEGYKSNGYKIDDRDRRDQRKKDFTGGKMLLRQLYYDIYFQHSYSNTSSH